MSIHGNQKFFPFALNSSGKIIKSSADYAIALKKCLDQRKDGETLVEFSRLAWPLIITQGSPTSHILFDDIGICDLKIEITNSPRQSTIGHVLRNIESRSYEEMLDYIKNIILYTEKGQKIETKNDEETEEFKKVSINAIMPPSITSELGKIWSKIIIAPISHYALLESKYSVEIVLNLSLQYRNNIDIIKGNKIRWKNLKNLIYEPFQKWLNDLSAQIKDNELRYKSTINKEESSITARNVEDLLNSEYDFLQQWGLQQKKGVLEKMGGAFLPIDHLIEKLRNRNKFFVNTERFKTTAVDRAVQAANNHILYVEEIKEKIGDNVENVRKSIKGYMHEIKNIDQEIKERLEKKRLELKTKLAQRNSRILTVSQASEKHIEQLKNAENSLERKFEEINNIIDTKMSDCDQDQQNLLNWGILNEIIGSGMSVQRIFLPIFVGSFEDEEEDERLVFIFPCIVEKDLLIKVLNGLEELAKKTERIVESDMKTRSNFEFTMERMNLLKNEDCLNIIKDGFTVLKNLGLCDNSISSKYISILSELLKTNK
ncbi:MAG: hypothetical protein ACTSWY_07690 [Promethearchaeota archaeon]